MKATLTFLQRSSLLQVALEGCRRRCSKISEKQKEENERSYSTEQQPELWLDDEALKEKALQAHRESPEYKELHRPYMSTSDLGLYGGEPGFEVSPRIYVDPDRPHIKEMYTTRLGYSNMRSLRYGAFKPQFPIINVDKLVRYARLIPSAEKVLNDIILMKIGLPDESCAALVRLSRNRISQLQFSDRRGEYWKTEQMFERMLATAVPPCFCGPETHVEMIRLATVCRRFEEGYHWFRQRAYEEAQRVPDQFHLTSDFHASIIELCAECEEIAEGMQELEILLGRGFRAPRAGLCAAQKLCALGKLIEEGEEIWKLYDFYKIKKESEDFEARFYFAGEVANPQLCFAAIVEADQNETPLTAHCFSWMIYAMRDSFEHVSFMMTCMNEMKQRGLEIHYLVLTQAFAFCARYGACQVAQQLMEEIVEGFGVKLTPEIVLLYLQSLANANSPSSSSTLGQNHLQVGVPSTSSHPSTILSPASLFLPTAIRALHAVEKIARENFQQDLFHAFLAFCAKIGAISNALSVIKKLVAFEEERSIPVECINLLLLCNANSQTGTDDDDDDDDDSFVTAGVRGFTEEILSLYQTVVSLSPMSTSKNDLDASSSSSSSLTIETIIYLQRCLDMHGTSPMIDFFIEQYQLQPMLKDVVRATKEVVDDEVGGKKGGALVFPAGSAITQLEADPPLRDFFPSPKELTPLQVPIPLDRTAIVLKKLGQYSPNQNRHPARSDPMYKFKQQPLGHYFDSS